MRTLTQSGVLVIDAHGTVRYANASMTSRFRANPAAILGRPFIEFFVSDDPEANNWPRLLERSLFERGVVEPRWLIQSTGERQPALVALSAMQSDSSALPNVCAVIRQPEAASQNAGDIGNLLEAAPDALIVVNRHGQIVMLNSQCETTFGFSRSELYGQPVERLIPERFRERHPVLRDAYFHSPHARPMGGGEALYGLRRDGTEFPVEISLRPLRVGDDNMVIAAIRDVTDRKRLEQGYQALLEAAPDAFVITDQQGLITLVNHQAERIFGYPRSELLGRSVEVLLPDRLRSQHVVHRRGYVESPRVRPMGTGRVLFGRRKSGLEFPVEISLSPLVTPEGTRIIAAIRDVSELRGQKARLQQIEDLNRELMRGRQALEAQNRELEKANRELGEFTYVASHDLQEPLRKLLSFGKLLPMDLGGDLPEKAAQDLAFITDAAARMQALVQDLLSLSRAGRNEMVYGDVSLDACVARALDVLEARVAETSAVVHVDSMGTVRGDETLLTQLFQNLLGNALKFHRPGQAPEVWVGVEETADGRVYSVRDSGIGIKSEYLDRVFAPFKRLHSQTEYEGSGIGLAICRTVVERHGGRIWAESGEGQGACFRFTLGATEERDAWSEESAIQRSFSS